MCYPAFTSASAFLSDRVQVRHDELLAGVAKANLGDLDVEVTIGVALGQEHQHVTLHLDRVEAPAYAPTAHRG